MAIDTASKRASALGVAITSIALIIPSGAISAAERQTISHCYSGILANPPVVVSPDCYLVLSSVINPCGASTVGVLDPCGQSVDSKIDLCTSVESLIGPIAIGVDAPLCGCGD